MRRAFAPSPASRPSSSSRSLGLEPAAIQSLLATAALPWSVKPLYGLVSDAVPIRGQHRKPYLVLAAAVGLAAWSGLALLAAPGAAAASLPPLTAMALLTALLLLSNLSTALSDVVVDAMVAEAAAREAASSGGQSAAGTEGENALQSLCWGKRGGEEAQAGKPLRLRLLLPLAL